MPPDINPQPNITPIAGLPPQPAPPDHKKNWKKWLPFAAAAVAMIVTMIYLVGFRKSATPAPLKLTKISVRLEWVNNPEFAGMYVAQEMGYYKAAGLDVNLKEYENGSDLNKEVAAGEVDYGVSTPLEVILARDKDYKNKAIAAIYQTSAFSFVSKKSSNIHTPSDFAGKVLGNQSDNNEAKVTYAILMAIAGLKPTDATFKVLGFDLVKTFSENQADTSDLYRTDQAYFLDRAKIPYNLLNPEDFGFAIYGDVLIASDNIIAQKPAQTEKFVQATLKGWQYALAHRDQTLAILAKHDNVEYKDPAYVAFDWDGTTKLIKPSGDHPLGNMQFVPWNRAYEGVREAGLLTKNYNAEDSYTSRFIK